MLMQSFKLMIVVVCLLALSAATVSAQNSHRFEIEVPFQFVMNGRTLPAGRYLIDRMDPNQPNILMFKNRKRGIARLIIMQRVESENPSDASCLVFVRRDEKYYLFRVWALGEKNGNEIPSMAGHVKPYPDTKNLTLVTLKAGSP